MKTTLRCIFCVLAASLVAFIVLNMAGCSNHEECGDKLDTCELISQNSLSIFNDQCEHLASCMKSKKWSIVHLKHQSHNPYTCSISMDKIRNYYFYPDAEISFGKVSSKGLRNSIATCEMMTHTGEFSDKAIKDMYDLFKKMDEERKERRKPAPPPKQIKILEEE